MPRQRPGLLFLRRGAHYPAFLCSNSGRRARISQDRDVKRLAPMLRVGPPASRIGQSRPSRVGGSTIVQMEAVADAIIRRRHRGRGSFRRHRSTWVGAAPDLASRWPGKLLVVVHPPSHRMAMHGPEPQGPTLDPLTAITEAARILGEHPAPPVRAVGAWLIERPARVQVVVATFA